VSLEKIEQYVGELEAIKHYDEVKHERDRLAAKVTELEAELLKTVGLPVQLTAEYGTPIITVQSLVGATLPFAIDAARSGMMISFGALSLFP